MTTNEQHNLDDTLMTMTSMVTIVSITVTSKYFIEHCDMEKYTTKVPIISFHFV